MACLILSRLQQRGSLGDLGGKKCIVSRRFWIWHNCLSKFLSLDSSYKLYYTRRIDNKKGGKVYFAQFNRREWLWCPVNMIW